MTIRFDNSLASLADIIANELGEAELRRGVALRDVSGRLAYFASTNLEESIVERLSSLLAERLGGYARTDRVLATATDLGASAILREAGMQVRAGTHRVRVVDRRLVGVDWLRAPANVASLPPRFVFASIKGGVGRSTALAVAATHQARRGRRVLVIDLDLEAPGLGPILLRRDTVPTFGTLDALVEMSLDKLDAAFMADLVGPSQLADQHGRIDVVPAFGRASLENPGDVLAKLARAYGESISDDGSVLTFRDRVSTLVDALIERAEYDVVLVDARAGLHESTAAAVLGLGGEVLFFGLDEPQTFEGYSALFAHLRRLASANAERPEWLDRLTMIQGKAPVDAERRAAFADRCRVLLDQVFAGNATAVGDPDPPVIARADIPWDDDVSDEDVDEHVSREASVLAILHDSSFFGFDPLTQRDQLSETVYEAVFGEFLALIDAAVSAANEEG